jgi:hypothetical protein
MVLQANINLVYSGKPCWLQDLRIALLHLPAQCSLPSNLYTMAVSDIDELQKKIIHSTNNDLLSKIQTMSQTYILRDRLEPQEDSSKRKCARTLRHYLVQITNEKHRKAITLLMFGQHIFSNVRLGWGTTIVPKENRLCRFCWSHIETPEHAILQCMFDQQTVHLRNELCQAVLREHSNWQIPISLTDIDSLNWFRQILFDWKLVRVFGKYFHEISEHWSKTEAYLFR